MTEFDRLDDAVPTTYLTDVEPIWSGAVIPSNRDVLAQFVESPLLAACEAFYDKNIRTIISSANGQDAMRGFAWITLDYSTMSDRNREVITELGVEVTAIPLPEGDELLVAGLKIPITLDTTIDDLSARAVAIVDAFEMQPMLWAPTCALGNLRGEGEEGMSDDEVAARATAAGNYYDPLTGLVYLSEEHFRKTNPDR